MRHRPQVARDWRSFPARKRNRMDHPRSQGHVEIPAIGYASYVNVMLVNSDKNTPFLAQKIACAGMFFKGYVYETSFWATSPKVQNYVLPHCPDSEKEPRMSYQLMSV